MKDGKKGKKKGKGRVNTRNSFEHTEEMRQCLPQKPKTLKTKN